MSGVWKIKALPRVLAFGWLALKGGILTMDNLRRQKRIVVNACTLSLANEETVDHLLLNCRVAYALRRSVLSWFKCSWVLYRSVKDLSESCLLLSFSVRGRVMWRTSFVAIL